MGGVDPKKPESEWPPPLPRLERRIFEAWLAALKDDDARVRRHALRVFRRWHIDESVRSVDDLVDLLKAKDCETRRSAIAAAAFVRLEQAVPGLIGLLGEQGAGQNKESPPRLGALAGEGYLDGPGYGIKQGLEQEARHALISIGAPAVGPLAQVVKDPKSPIRRQAVWILGQLDTPKALRALLEFVGDGDPEVRATVAYAIGRFPDRYGDEAVVSALLKLLKDSNADVRRSAVCDADDLKELPGEVRRVLEEIAQSDEDYSVRNAAARALQRGDSK